MVYFLSLPYKTNERFCFCLLGQSIESKDIDLQFSLEDLETIKVIGKGSGGVVQLVRHKWVGILFALKVSPQATQFSNSFCILNLATRSTIG